MLDNNHWVLNQSQEIAMVSEPHAVYVCWCLLGPECSYYAEKVGR